MESLRSGVAPKRRKQLEPSHSPAWAAVIGRSGLSVESQRRSALARDSRLDHVAVKLSG